jgi:hypothetical protein
MHWYTCQTIIRHKRRPTSNCISSTQHFSHLNFYHAKTSSFLHLEERRPKRQFYIHAPQTCYLPNHTHPNPTKTSSSNAKKKSVISPLYPSTLQSSPKTTIQMSIAIYMKTNKIISRLTKNASLQNGPSILPTKKSSPLQTPSPSPSKSKPPPPRPQTASTSSRPAPTAPSAPSSAPNTAAPLSSCRGALA